MVLDAPPTGRIAQFLNVNNELAGLAKVGPIKSQADTVMPLFRSRATAVHLVTVLEEMPVQETADGIAELREHGLPVGGVVVNLVRPRDLDERRPAPAIRAGKVDQARGRRPTSTAAGLTGTGDAGRRAARRGPRPRRAPGARGRAARAWSASSACRRTSCPRLAGGVDLGGLYELAAELLRAGAGMTRPRPPRPRRPAGRPQRRPARRRSTSTRCSTTRDTGIIVCCGSGGVGKTTTSAALALRAAERGRKVVVLTIDPARRLAQSMGIEELDNTPRPVPGVDAAPAAARSTR